LAFSRTIGLWSYQVIGELFRGVSCGHASDGFEDFGARVSFLKIGRTTCGFGLSAGGEIIVCSDEDKGGRCALGKESLSQLYAGHATELDVEHEAIEPRLFRIPEKCFRRRIHDRLKSRGPEEAAKRLAQAFIVIDDGDVDLFSGAHRQVMNTVDPGGKCRLLSFREGEDLYASFEREPCHFRHGRHAQFGRNALAMAFDRAFRDPEIIGNLFVQPSPDHMTEHLALALA
jgi:hypothetical protein